MKKYVLALDQGTTSCRAILFDKEGECVVMAQKEFVQIYPAPGWVEHDPMEIWQTQIEVAHQAIDKAGAMPAEIAAIGITNQRETAVVWDKTTGKPIYNAIVWQCRRTADICDELKRKGLEEYIQHKTGLVVDAYFSATKISWILRNVPGAMDKAEKGDLLFGTIDTWLVWNLTNGEVHVTDYSNASRTMLYDIHSLRWDEKLLGELKIPRSMLSEVRPSSEEYGATDTALFDGMQIPISGMIGDQQAALFGQKCFNQGEAKNTYGTGCFILMNTGKRPVSSKHNLVTTIAWGIGDEVEYALEGSVFNAGSSVKWLRDEMRLIDSAAESGMEAEKVPDTGGVYVVPAFTGLGAPYWDMYARGAVVGITRGTNRQHVIRATLESIAYQSQDILEVMQEDAGVEIAELKVDGGASVNRFLMQFQADISDAKVVCGEVAETTALGAAYLAGLAVKFWDGKDALGEICGAGDVYIPNMDAVERAQKYRGWKKAVQRSMDWES